MLLQALTEKKIYKNKQKNKLQFYMKKKIMKKNIHIDTKKVDVMINIGILMVVH